MNPEEIRKQTRARIATLRANRKALGLCPDCGGDRDSVYLRCGVCRANLVIAVDKSQFKKRERLRMAKATLR